MDSQENPSDYMNENQSLLVIKEMIEVSKNRFRKDGILFIVWGWALFFGSFAGFITRSVPSFGLTGTLNKLGIIIPLSAAAFTVYYIIKQRNKVQTYIGTSLRFVWISLFICMVLVNLIQFNVLHAINFELQHPIFMVLMAFAVTVTGGILRYRLIIAGGIIFGLLALTASYLGLKEQLLIEAVAWIIAFIIPGHILYANRK